MSGTYDDIIALPHPEPRTHPRMSLHDRAAQFSPFAALTGSPVFTYINILRINNAKQLIATTDLPFSEIGYLVGVEDRYYFSKLFRKMTGMSPSDYYKEVRSE